MDRGPAASTKQGSTRALVALLAFVLGFATVPHRVMEREAASWLRDEPAKVDALAAGVERWTVTSHGITPPSFSTGASRFDGEWLTSMYTMAAIGFGQLALARSAEHDANLARMETCLDAILEPRVRNFDTTAWGGDALESLATAGTPQDRGHVAYLGYAGVALALHHIVSPASRFVDKENAIIDALSRRIDESSAGLIETYPNEIYPADNAAALAALALHAHALGQPPPPAFARGMDALNRHGTDPKTGLLFHTVTPATASARDGTRASATALAAYFLTFADGTVSRSLFAALEKSQFRTVLGFGGMMEYPPGKELPSTAFGSGPVLLGFGVAASGFALGIARAHGSRDVFTSLYATAHLFGVPLDESGVRNYVAGGALGDAILFAMLTTPRIGTFTS